MDHKTVPKYNIGVKEGYDMLIDALEEGTAVAYFLGKIYNVTKNLDDTFTVEKRINVEQSVSATDADLFHAIAKLEG